MIPKVVNYAPGLALDDSAATLTVIVTIGHIKTNIKSALFASMISLPSSKKRNECLSD